MVDDVRHGDRLGPSTYLTDSEAREFHSLFITSFIAFTIVAIIAHILVWNWRPWIPGPDGYAMSKVPAVAEATITSQA